MTTATSGAARSVVPAEVALVVVSAVAVAGTGRLFSDRSSVVALLLAVGAAHLTGMVGRRMSWGPLVTGAATAAVTAGIAVWGLYPHTTTFGVPTPVTLEAMGDDLAAAWRLFQEVRAPAPRSRGFLLGATVVLGVSVALADWAAFRLGAVAEAVLPAGAVVAFTVLLGEGPGGVLLTASFVGAVLVFAVLQRARRAADDTWVGGDGGPGPAAMVRAGVALAVAVAVAAAVAGPRLPTAADEPLLDWRGDDGGGSRTTVSPLVDIRARLVDRSERVVFEVRADAPAYWRLTALPDFDGQVWSSSESFEEADGELSGEDASAASAAVVQTFTVLGLETIWAPAAQTPVELVESDTPLRWNADLATLIVPSDVETIDGTTYTVVSEAPRFTPGDLSGRLPDDDDLPDDAAAARSLPADLPPVVARLARDVSAGATGPYEVARALQDWFRTEFTYDLEGTAAGHDVTAIEAFLEERRGYCEQFAGTFAAMARTLGLPTRVAVGFTPGEVGPDGDRYTVRGRNAHAWPEVWFPDAGWVPFEPTPGRGQPGAESHTGVAAAQDDPVPLPPVDTAPPADATGPDPAPTSAGDTTTTMPTTTTTQPEDRAATPPPAEDDPSPPWWRSPWVLVPLAAVLLVGADLALVAWLRARRDRRRRVDGSVPGRVRRAWWEALDALRSLDLAPAASETPREFARRVRTGHPGAGAPLHRLAGLVTATTWVAPGRALDPDVATEALRLAAEVREDTRGDRGWRDRVRDLVDPRPLLGTDGTSG